MGVWVGGCEKRIQVTIVLYAYVNAASKDGTNL